MLSMEELPNNVIIIDYIQQNIREFVLMFEKKKGCMFKRLFKSLMNLFKHICVNFVSNYLKNRVY